MDSQCPADLKALFEKIDVDHDGKISLAEFKEGYKQCPEYKLHGDAGLEAVFAKYDKDHDKTLDCKEFCTMIRGEHCCKNVDSKCCDKEAAVKCQTGHKEAQDKKCCNSAGEKVCCNKEEAPCCKKAVA